MRNISENAWFWIGIGAAILVSLVAAENYQAQLRGPITYGVHIATR